MGKTIQITPEENALFDKDNGRLVERYLQNNIESTAPYVTSDLTRLNGNQETNTLISINEIISAIKSLKNDTPGETMINRTILRNLPENALIKLQGIYSHTLSMGYFPHQFKTAIIKLLPKGNLNHTNPLNYRPISLLEVTGKLLEKIVNHRLKRHLDTNNILPDSQHGFRNNRGTDTAITTIHESIAQQVSKKHQCYIILRDVSKAFDKVWHEGLKYKLLQIKLPIT